MNMMPIFEWIFDKEELKKMGRYGVLILIASWYFNKSLVDETQIINEKIAKIHEDVAIIQSEMGIVKKKNNLAYFPNFPIPSEPKPSKPINTNVGFCYLELERRQKYVQ